MGLFSFAVLLTGSGPAPTTTTISTSTTKMTMRRSTYPLHHPRLYTRFATIIVLFLALLLNIAATTKSSCRRSYEDEDGMGGWNVLLLLDSPVYIYKRIPKPVTSTISIFILVLSSSPISLVRINSLLTLDIYRHQQPSSTICCPS